MLNIIFAKNIKNKEQITNIIDSITLFLDVPSFIILENCKKIKKLTIAFCAKFGVKYKIFSRAYEPWYTFPAHDAILSLYDLEKIENENGITVIIKVPKLGYINIYMFRPINSQAELKKLIKNINIDVKTYNPKKVIICGEITETLRDMLISAKYNKCTNNFFIDQYSSGSVTVFKDFTKIELEIKRRGLKRIC